MRHIVSGWIDTPVKHNSCPVAHTFAHSDRRDQEPPGKLSGEQGRRVLVAQDEARVLPVSVRRRFLYL